MVFRLFLFSFDFNVERFIEQKGGIELDFVMTLASGILHLASCILHLASWDSPLGFVNMHVDGIHTRTFTVQVDSSFANQFIRGCTSCSIPSNCHQCFLSKAFFPDGEHTLKNQKNQKKSKKKKKLLQNCCDETRKVLNPHTSNDLTPLHHRRPN